MVAKVKRDLERMYESTAEMKKMELFEKIYSCYYQVVGQILRESERHPVTVKEMEGIIRKYGFQESVLTILPNLTAGNGLS